MQQFQNKKISIKKKIVRLYVFDMCFIFQYMKLFFIKFCII